jgi:hypothetical protein
MGLLAAGCLTIIVGWLGLALFGHLLPRYEGSEFSPYSFNVREFYIGRWFGKMVVQPARLVCSMEISKHLTNAARSSGVERWDLVECSHSVQGIDPCEASVLIEAFQARDSENDLFWEKWSKEHPELAKILWPAVQQLAIHRGYFAIPSLLQQAATTPTPEELTSLIVATSMRAAIDQSHRELAKREFNEARITLEWGKSLGSSPELTALENSLRAGFEASSEDNQ